MNATILRGDVFAKLPEIPAGSVDCVVTSPPYWMLRSYLPKGHALKPLELGSEPTPAAYVANMVKVFALVREAMAEHATCWLNVGDSYSQGRAGNVDGATGSTLLGGKATQQNARLCSIGSDKKTASGLENGNLCLIPQRLALALQADGWIVRSVVVWHKPAPMPASLAGWRWMRCRVKVKSGTFVAANGKQTADRATMGNAPLAYNGQGALREGRESAEWQDCPSCPKCTTHGGYVLRRGSWRPTSSWEPVLMLAKSARYFCDGESVKTPPAAATVSRDQYTRVLDDPDEQFAVQHDHETVCESGANLRDVWTIAAEPLKEKHYAAYPTALVTNCLKAGTSAKGYCPACGAPWCRVVESEPMSSRPNSRPVGASRGVSPSAFRAPGQPQQAGQYAEVTTLGWRASCSCDAGEPRPGLVLDPFAGSGRTAIAAMRLGLDFVGVELNPDYADLCERLIRDDAPLFNRTA